MSKNPKTRKYGRNEPCPCLSGLKYKYCCEPNFDWNEFLRNDGDFRQELSVRGRNLIFLELISEALQFDNTKTPSLENYKKAFTSEAVRKINEAILFVWPQDLDIDKILRKSKTDVSGLYVGDYNIEYLQQGIIRHSIYANKILIVDPFVYPLSVKDEFNPLINPEQYRTQTLKNVNFWFSIHPFIESGLVEVIRTPDDFDPQLAWDSMQHQIESFKNNKELEEANQKSADLLSERHMDNQAKEQILLSAPDSYLRKVYKETARDDGVTEQEFLDYINQLRTNNPNVIGQMGPGGSLSGQMHLMTTGAHYTIGKITADITGSYLVTDMHSFWKQIEIDRKNNNAESKLWSPFAKAIQETKFKYLNAININHAITLRTEGRLESLRHFLHKTWRLACSSNSFDETNATLLTEELNFQINEAEKEWNKIDEDLIKMTKNETLAGILSAGPLIATGSANFLAAYAITSGVANLGLSAYKRKQFPKQFPASFFMNLD